MSEPSFHIQTLGCRVNQYDEELLRRDFLRRGFREVDFEERADVYVINTCTVTHIADRKSRQMIRRALRANPQARVIATGCAVGNHAALAGGIPRNVIQVSNKDKERLLDVVRDELPPHHARDERAGDGVQARARALLKVQDGCNQFCTFCIVPFVRGRARSKPPEAVLEEARGLVAAGYREIVVTGVHVGSYGRDLSKEGPYEDWSLGRLMRLLAERSGAARVRLSSIEPADFPLEVLDMMVEHAALCRHLHLALQHASDPILERMRRGYTLAQYDAIVERFLDRFPDGALTADVLVGFPGENEADFARLTEYLASRPFAHLHVFPYSVRPGTAAARCEEKVPEAVLQERMRIVLELSARGEQAFRERFVGREVEVLVEEYEASGEGRGTTDNYLSVRFTAPPGQAPPLGSLGRVRVARVGSDGVQGRLLATLASHPGSTGGKRTSASIAE